MDQDRGQDHEADDRPQPLAASEIAVVEAVSDVIDRPHAPDAEEGEQHLLPPRLGRSDHGDQPRDRPHDQQDRQPDQGVHPGQARHQSVGQRPAEQHQQQHDQQPLDLVGQVMHLLVEFVLPLPIPDRHRRHEDRQKPVAVRQFGRGIGDEGRRQRHQPVAEPREAPRLAAEQQQAKARPDRPADAEARRDFPDHIDQRPVGQLAPHRQPAQGRQDR